MMNELEEAYMTLQDNSGINAGDSVKILRKAGDRELGWGSCWNDDMDEYVGKSGVVEDVYEFGISVSIDDDWWNYPFFVLEKTPKPHWRDTVSPENPVICYVRDGEDEEWSLPVAVIRADNFLVPKYPYIVDGVGYAYANRVPKSMIESMLKAYDETSEDE